jgi:hypothetical protein
MLDMEAAMSPDVHRISDIAIAVPVTIALCVYIVRPLWRVYRGQGPNAALQSLKWLLLTFVS